jgi:hypothetical protein
MGPSPLEEVLEAHYLRMRAWDIRKSLGPVMDSKYMFDSDWTQTYIGLKEIMEDAERRPDAIVADFFVDAAKDMLIRKSSILEHTSLKFSHHLCM